MVPRLVKWGGESEGIFEQMYAGILAVMKMNAKTLKLLDHNNYIRLTVYSFFFYRCLCINERNNKFICTINQN